MKTISIFYLIATLQLEEIEKNKALHTLSPNWPYIYTLFLKLRHYNIFGFPWWNMVKFFEFNTEITEWVW